MGDIIDLKGRRIHENSNVVDTHRTPIMDITEIREKQIQHERREAKRTVIDGLVGFSVVIPGRGLLKVNLFDVSKSGLAFDMSGESGHFRENEEVAVRFYFSQTVYFPFVVKISSCRLFHEEGFARHGATFQPDLSNMLVLEHFVNFIEAVSISLRKDSGDLFINEFGG